MSDVFPITFGRYELVERLAVGGMAELFLARATGAHGFAKTLVIKRILPHLAADDQFTAMFIDEAKITARLAHPKIAQTFELGHESGRLYIAMEFVEGLDVLAILRECAHRRVRISPEVSVYVCKETLDALDFAHRLADDAGKPLGIVHRDISPSNVLVSRRGDVKLVDFGIAHALASEHHTKAGTLKGKYGYMSPEQVLGSGVTPRSDLFSVGVVLAEMLTGRRLFAAPNELDVLLMVRDVKLDRLERFGSHIAPDLMAIMRRALAKVPADRYDDAAGFRDALDEWLFDNRHRVGPRNVSDLVESLHADAMARRESAMAESVAKLGPTGSDGTAGTRPASGVHAGAVLAGAPISAAPVGTPAGPPVPEPVPAPPPPPPVAARPKAARAPAQAAPAEPAVEDDATGRFVRQPPQPSGPGAGYIDLGDLLGDPLAASPLAGAEPLLELGAEPLPPGRRAATELASPQAKQKGGPPQPPRKAARPVVEATPDAIEEELSMRFPDIGAAVASVSKAPIARAPDMDPADSGFDGSELQGKRRRVPRLSAADVARAPKHAPPVAAEILDTPAEAGDLAINPPIKILFKLAVAKSSGLLVVSVGEIKKEIYIADGVPEFVSSNLAGELFGAYLVSESAISTGELDMALAMLPYFGGKLGDTLVGLGLMKPLDVFRHLTRQVRSKLLDVCTWTKGNYTWYAGKKNPREAFPLDLDPFEVLGAGAMACDPDYLSEWAAGRLAQVFRVTAKPKTPPEQFKVGKIARDVQTALDGKSSLGEILRRFAKEEDKLQFLRVLHLFVLVDQAKVG